MMPLILEAALRSLLLGLAVWIALALVRPRNPHLHKTVWLTVLVASLAMPFVLGLGIAPAVSLDALFQGVLSAGGKPSLQDVLTLNVTGTGNDAPLAGWLGAAAALYALVTLALLARFIVGLLRLRAIRNTAQIVREPWAQSIDVRASAAIRSPATFGHTILLPIDFTAWTEQKLAAVLAHERSHVRRHDCYVLWLARLNICVFWINPLAWWIHARLASLAETTSDDAVVEVLGDRAGYAEVLLETAASSPMAHAAVAMVRSDLSARIEHIISNVPPARVPGRLHKALTVGLLLPAVVASAATLYVPTAALAQTNTMPAPPSNDSVEQKDRKPRVVGGVTLETLMEYYPKQAKREGVEGLVDISILLDAQGRPTDTQILSETPLDVGFGAAASAGARDEVRQPHGAAGSAGHQR
jgi:beta-lactamase regulating signal transducer with metallopeptidase domain